MFAPHTPVRVAFPSTSNPPSDDKARPHLTPTASQTPFCRRPPCPLTFLFRCKFTVPHALSRPLAPVALFVLTPVAGILFSQQHSRLWHCLHHLLTHLTDPGSTCKTGLYHVSRKPPFPLRTPLFMPSDCSFHSYLRQMVANRLLRCYLCTQLPSPLWSQPSDSSPGLH